MKNFLNILSKLISKASANNISIRNYIEEINLNIDCFFVLRLYPKISYSIFIQEFLEGLIKILENILIFNDNIVLRVFDMLKVFSESTSGVSENHEFVIKRMFVPILESSFTQHDDNKITPLNICANMITNLLDDDR
jgi:hypothetical protein